MKYFIESEEGVPIVNSVIVADSFVDRLIGLMFKKNMNGFDGLLIKDCKSIHTCFMNFSIDAIFLDKNYIIRKIIRDMNPWRVTRIYFGVAQVLEIKGGSLGQKIHVGDKTCVKGN